MTDDVLTRLADRDPNVSGLALGELVAKGSAAVPDLVTALGSDQVGLRRMAIEGLGDIADPQAAQAATDALSDDDGQVRSLAAVALARMGAPGALDALARTLDDWPDLAHSELSRSTYELPRLGLAALTVAIPLLDSDDWADRAKGAWVARAVLGQVEDHDTDRLREIVAGFDPDGDPGTRQAAASSAAEWLRESDLSGPEEGR